MDSGKVLPEEKSYELTHLDRRNLDDGNKETKRYSPVL